MKTNTLRLIYLIHLKKKLLKMEHINGKIGNEYKVEDIDLPVNIEKRLEALGMTRGTSIAVLNRKSRGVLIVKVRGTRFALGRNITKNILVG